MSVTTLKQHVAAALSTAGIGGEGGVEIPAENVPALETALLALFVGAKEKSIDGVTTEIEIELESNTISAAEQTRLISLREKLAVVKAGISDEVNDVDLLS
jgi:hypothetical protein